MLHKNNKLTNKYIFKTKRKRNMKKLFKFKKSKILSTCKLVIKK